MFGEHTEPAEELGELVAKALGVLEPPLVRPVTAWSSGVEIVLLVDVNVFQSRDVMAQRLRYGRKRVEYMCLQSS